MTDPRVIVALDYPDAKSALALVARLDPKLCRVKIGKELFTAAGPQLVENIHKAGFTLFLDLKYHDIPNTVASACAAAAQLGVWMVNVHALGGRAMMEAAREAMTRRGNSPKLIAVTLLTSMGPADVADVGLVGDPRQVVTRLARLAKECGLDGVVCSPQEAAELRRQCGKTFTLVTPGVRPGGTAQDDQQRVATPRQAITDGADYLVIGRPITRAPDPAAALSAINQDIATLTRSP
ncbi:MAG TPA: orotidine-5'-phosphate decarboxylase [Burkholderiales bacterium]|nr:orotidine-5'-phosphate decarboxylase [Burkholderiales bacterium]